MAKFNKANGGQKKDLALKNIHAAWDILENHPLFVPIQRKRRMLDLAEDEYTQGSKLIAPDGWAVVLRNGMIRVQSEHLAEPEEWAYIFAHCLLHLGLGHFQPPDEGDRLDGIAWNAACDVFVTHFLADLRLGTPPETFHHLPVLPAHPEERLYQRFRQEGVPEELRGFGASGANRPDMLFDLRRANVNEPRRERKVDWPMLLGQGLARAASASVRVASGIQDKLSEREDKRTAAQRARQWFTNHYPLLGALAGSFTIIEDPLICIRMEVSVAAVDDELREIYINPAADLDEQETRFVMAHEMLHSGLRHQTRRQGRDPYLWNVACDYVINSWLVEMGLGALPQFGGLYDPQLKDLSAETIYDRIVNDLRTYRKLATLRGIGLGDMLERRPGDREMNGETLDDFYRRCLAQGLNYHQVAGRGDLPAGLVEEIQALNQPPIPWDVALAQWFDHYFPLLEKVQTFARPSRRQSATPDIPRPSLKTPPGDTARTFGVVLDTSGSMNRHLLAKALGTISSYSLSREVPFVRVVFCDAAPYDQGYISPEDIAGRVQVKGRGGTVLQPGIDLLEQSEDFPKEGPLLIITDGRCDRLHVHREHAFLVPEGNHLSFAPRGEVFYFS
jgi:predicted metal-dependent peptidase